MNIVDLAILKKMVAGGGGSGTDNYNDLSNLPQINGETLAGNKTAANLGLQDALTFDSAPTEDSTNPVESGGVYNALAGKQDNLTFDDDPTENSTNPVKSGGVYSALAGKQDNLTFDGVYNASTNKAATESTVTNAIAGLDVSALSVDADETISSISETDGKVSVTKQDIAIASNQVVEMTGYAKPSSAPSNPAIQTSDTANQAFGKLEFKADTNQSNILSVANRTGKNRLPFLGLDALKSINTAGSWNNNAYTHNNVTFTVNTDGTISVSGTLASGETRALFYCFIYESNITLKDLGVDNVLSGCPSGGGNQVYGLMLEMAKSPYSGIAYDFSNHPSIRKPSAATDDSEVVCYIVVSTHTAVNVVFEPMISEPDMYALDPSYVPFALPNSDLTRLEAEDRASLAEVVDSGAKNLSPLNTAETSTSAGQAVFNVDNLNLASGTYVFSFTENASSVPSSGNIVQFSITYTDSTTENMPYITTAAKTRSVVTYTFAKAIKQIKIYAGYVGCSLINIMICTKAAFGVSNKFVPYRPNWDLVYESILNPVTITIDLHDDVTWTQGVQGIYYSSEVVVSGIKNIYAISVGNLSSIPNNSGLIPKIASINDNKVILYANTGTWTSTQRVQLICLGKTR